MEKINDRHTPFSYPFVYPSVLTCRLENDLMCSTFHWVVDDFLETATFSSYAATVTFQLLFCINFWFLCGVVKWEAILHSSIPSRVLVEILSACEQYILLVVVGKRLHSVVIVTEGVSQHIQSWLRFPPCRFHSQLYQIKLTQSGCICRLKSSKFSTSEFSQVPLASNISFLF